MPLTSVHIVYITHVYASLCVCFSMPHVMCVGVPRHKTWCPQRGNVDVGVSDVGVMSVSVVCRSSSVFVSEYDVYKCLYEHVSMFVCVFVCVFSCVKNAVNKGLRLVPLLQGQAANIFVLRSNLCVWLGVYRCIQWQHIRV